MSEAHFVTDVAVVLGVGAATGYVARRLGQATILGYLLAGLIVGPYLPIPLSADPARIQSLAEFGVILVMFAVGLEFRIAKLLSVLPTAGLTAAIQIAFLMYCGFSLGKAVGWDDVGSIFLGACIAISSTMVVSKVLEQQKVAEDVRQTVFGILVVQDVVAIVLIAAMTGIASGGGLAPLDLAITLGKLAVVLVGLLVGGLLVVPRALAKVVKLKSKELDAVVGLGLCFVMAIVAEYLGYSVALGAFLAGILVAESGIGAEMEHAIQPVRDMFAAIFFVSIGMTVDPLQAWNSIGLSLLLFVVVLVAQFVSVALTSVLSGAGLRRSVIAGLALGQVGEFAFILAAIGIEAGVVPNSLRPVLVTVALLTSFTTPLALRYAERVVHAIDAGLPVRVRHLVDLQAEWVNRSRSADSADHAPQVKAVRALIVDAVGLIVLVGMAALARSTATEWLSNLVHIDAQQTRLLIAVAAIVLAAPLVFAAARNARAFARVRSQRLVTSMDPSATVTVSRTLEAMLTALVLTAVVLPFTVFLSITVGTALTMGGIAIVFAIVALQLWRTAGDTEVEFQSAVTRLSDALAATRLDAHEPKLVVPSLLPGLDRVTLLTLESDEAVGKTLAQLDLRARSGATVVAVRRASGNLTLPSGTERLERGDVVALAGTNDAIANARGILGGEGDE
jgi:monovalent cation:H+ antiporter-2, CPA2 family